MRKILELYIARYANHLAGAFRRATSNRELILPQCRSDSGSIRKHLLCGGLADDAGIRICIAVHEAAARQQGISIVEKKSSPTSLN
jgi:hypothetical protein